MNKLIVGFILSCLLVTWFAVGSLGQSTPPIPTASPDVSGLALAGVTAVSVIAEDTRPELQQVGLTRERIEAITKLRLRRNGMPIASGNSPIDPNLGPNLYVNINSRVINLGSTSLTCFAVQLKYGEEVYLARNSRTRMRASTYETASLGYAGRDRMDVIETSLGEQLDEFVNLWHEQNGR